MLTGSHDMTPEVIKDGQTLASKCPVETIPPVSPLDQ